MHSCHDSLIARGVVRREQMDGGNSEVKVCLQLACSELHSAAALDGPQSSLTSPPCSERGMKR